MPTPKADDPSKHAEAQRSYHQRQIERGMVRLSVYVPDADRDAFWDAVEDLRTRWKRRGLID